MSRVFPEISTGVAMELLGELRRRDASGTSPLDPSMASYSHPRAAPPATGGRAVTEKEIRDLADHVTESMKPWLQESHNDSRGFDLTLGAVLHEELRISAATASREGLWSFLTLVVFPNILLARFPHPTDERALGRPRNVLRRVWQRQDVLGDVIHGANQLREDEFVQIMERTALVRTPDLARLVVQAVLRRPPVAREDFTRELTKEVVRRTGPLLLDALTHNELLVFVDECVARVDAPSGLAW